MKLAACAMGLFAATTSLAQEALLTVTGRIQRTNSIDHKTLTLSWSDLLRLGQVRVHAITARGGRSEFAGPLLRDILREACIARGATEAVLTGRDGQSVRIPLDDFSRWDVIAAHTQNGRRMDKSGQGPLWVMYPNERYPDELQNGATAAKLVVALSAIEVR
jgi:hypothetical protein